MMRLLPRAPRRAPRAPRRGPRTLAIRPVAVAAVVLVVAACGSSATSAPSVASVVPSSAAPAASTSAASPSVPSSAPSTGLVATSAPSVAPGSSGAPVSPAITVTIDPGLARLLPLTVGSVSVTEATATEDAARTSARFADSASGFAAVEVVKSVDADLAIGSIIRLRPEVSSSTFYADWRPSFDDAACRPAGGVSTRETQHIGGRSVDVTHCLEGATLYHVWLGGEKVLVSILDVGPSGLGRALVEGAKDPAP